MCSECHKNFVPSSKEDVGVLAEKDGEGQRREDKGEEGQRREDKGGEGHGQPRGETVQGASWGQKVMSAPPQGEAPPQNSRVINTCWIALFFFFPKKETSIAVGGV